MLGGDVALLEKYKELQIELEKAHQDLYDCRRQVKSTKCLEAEHQDDIKILQNQAAAKEKELTERIQQLEESTASAKATYNDRIIYLEKESSDKDQEIVDLKKHLEDVIRISQMQEPIIDPKLFDELTQLREDNIDSQGQLLEVEKMLKESRQQCLQLEERVKQLEGELADHTEILKCKREELDEARILNQNLRDELTCAQSELESVRSCPLDQGSKGNSLFAEVDDRRLQLQQNMSTMKSRYIDMKRDRASLLKQIQALRNENTTLITQLEGEINERKYDGESIIEAYKSQVQTLNELVESYKKELNNVPKVEDVTAQGLKFFENMLALKNEEVEGWRQKFSARSINYTSLSYDLAEAKRKIRQLTLENLHLKHEIDELKLKLKELQVESPTEKIQPTSCEDCSTQQKLKSIVKNTEGIPDENKENDGTKKVQFSENTIEPQITERNFRRRAKVMISKPVVFP